MKTTMLLALASLALVGERAPAAAGQAATNKWPGATVDRPVPAMPGMPILSRNLRDFDDLDFRVYTNQDWKNLPRSHATDIVVHYPDGHTTRGLPDHILALRGMWTFAPDNRITEHPVRFGTPDGEWTAVMGYLDGTFTRPMTLPGGKVIQPTGKKYHLPMTTLGHWNKQGTMSEEYLFWDNATLMHQMGIGE